MPKENPGLEWVQKSGRNCLKFTFEGTLTEEEAVQAIEKWREAFRSKPKEKIILIWECRRMAGYDTGSRVNWQEALKEMNNQIADIWLVTSSNFVKIGARVMSVFTSLNIHIVDSESDIEING